jgi:glutaredoxin 2
METRNSNKEKEINKAILEWLKVKNYNSTLMSFINETGLTENESTSNNQLERKWNSIVSQQKKLNEQETYIKQLKDDLEKASMGGSSSAPNGIVKNSNESMVIEIKINN